MEDDVDDPLDLRGREHTDRWVGDARRRDDLPGLRSQRRHRRPRTAGRCSCSTPGCCRRGVSRSMPSRSSRCSVIPNGPFSATFVGRVIDPTLADAPTTVIQSRHLGHGMREDLEVRHFGAESVTTTVGLRIGADFGGSVRRQGRAGEWVARTRHGRRRRRHHHRGRSDRSRRWCRLTGHSLPATPGIGRGRSAHVAAHPPAR